MAEASVGRGYKKAAKSVYTRYVVGVINLNCSGTSIQKYKFFPNPTVLRPNSSPCCSQFYEEDLRVYKMGIQTKTRPEIYLEVLTPDVLCSILT